MTSLLAWHGTRADGTTRHLEIKELVGVKTFLVGNVELCSNALHGSLRAVDMLQYSEGLWIKRTLHEGVVLHDTNKIGSSERTVIGEADATQVVVNWAFWCADRAVRIHAVAALRQAGMNIEAEKLVGLEAITDKKSALAASNAANTVRAAASNAANTVRAAAFFAANAVRDAANAADAAVRDAANAAAAADAAANAAGHAANTAAAYDAANTAAAYDAANAVEMEFLNAELERRLLALMGLTETEVIQ